MAQNTLFRRTLCSLQIRLAAPHSRKASLATPRRNLWGVCVCACGCVYASQKYGRSPRSSFLCVAPELSRCSLIAPRGGWLPPHFYRKASLATPRKLCGVFAFCPTRKIRDFSRGDPVCACGFAPQSVLALLRYFAGTPLCFRKRKMQDVRLLRVFSLCLETIALLSDFCSAGWAAPAACSFFKDERVLCCCTIMPPRHDQSIS